MDCLIVFESVHQAIHAEKLLQQHGVELEMIPTPREISVSCGQSIALSGCSLNAAIAILQKNRLLFLGVYQMRKKERIFERLCLDTVVQKTSQELETEG